MCVNDEEVFYKLLQENEYSDISESEYSSDCEINVKISSGGEQSVNSDEAENVSDSSSMQPVYGQIQVLSNHVFHLLTSLA
jgi:hypothetical protein